MSVSLRSAQYVRAEASARRLRAAMADASSARITRASEAGSKSGATTPAPVSRTTRAISGDGPTAIASLA
jgi:hypothetical protein